MRTLLALLVAGALALCGCAGQKGSLSPAAGSAAAAGRPASASPRSTNQPLIITPDNTATGTVVLVDPAIRCVVLNFPLGRMAPLEQRLGLYRRGLKVGEVKVTGPQREDNIVADLVAGEAQVGDDARTQ